MLEKKLKQLIDNAIFRADKDNYEYFTLEHLLLALIIEDKLIIDIFKSFKVDLRKLERLLDKYISDNIPQNKNGIAITKSVENTINDAINQRVSSGNKIALASHLLIALMDNKASFGVYLLKEFKVNKLDLMSYVSKLDREENNKGKTNSKKDETDDKRVEIRSNLNLADAIIEITDGNIKSIKIDGDEIINPNDAGKLSESIDFTKIFGIKGESDFLDSLEEEEEESDEKLEDFCLNLNELAQKGKIDPLIGREKEVDRLIQILCRRKKNNPILVGEAGVGKTAIAEGLARKIVEKQVPKILKDTIIYSLDLGSVVAGTKYRGEFEERIKNIIAELIAMDDVIIFIDEIHNIFGAGSPDGVLDAANLLKPALASGNLRCIGATTYKEYKNTFEKNSAVARRFQKVDVKATNNEESYQILQGLKSSFEKFHKVKYSDDSLKLAVELSDKYIHGRYLPDKAIDLIDEAGSKAKISSKRKINAKDIENIVAKIAKIPNKTVSNNDKLVLKSLALSLKKLIFGQDEAINGLVDAIKLSRAGLKDLEKPIGSFLFTGPTGVGKTEVCKQLAKQMGIKFLRFDMSEYMEAHSVSKLIGSPPGYVGFDQGGLLTESVHNNPYCIVLLDEIEKAHFDIFNILLQIMDYGSLTDNNGKTVNFSNVILVMTSNVGADKLEKSSIGFSNSEANEVDNSAEVKKVFSPEFRNRLTDIIEFSYLSNQSILAIAGKLLSELSILLQEKNITLSITTKAKQLLVKQGYNKKLGARPMQRLISRKIKQPIAEKLLFGNIKTNAKLSIALNEKGDDFVIKLEKLKVKDKVK